VSFATITLCVASQQVFVIVVVVVVVVVYFGIDPVRKLLCIHTQNISSQCAFLTSESVRRHTSEQSHQLLLCKADVVLFKLQ
jgi:predicted metalloprotease